jgi:hypothetical protein
MLYRLSVWGAKLRALESETKLGVISLTTCFHLDTKFATFAP